MAGFIPIIAQAAGPAIAGLMTYAIINGKGVATENLKSTTEDIVPKAKENKLRGRCFGREPILNKLISSLGTGRGIYILSGPAGSGKTAIIEEIAYRIAENRIPTLKDARILRLANQSVKPKSGIINHWKAEFFGNVEETLVGLIDELGKTNEDGGTKKPNEKKPVTILFIDEIHEILRDKPKIIFDRLALLDSYGVIIVGATTDTDLQQSFARADEAAGRRLTDIRLDAMTAEQAIDALWEGVRHRGLLCVKQLKVYKNAIEAIVLLSDIESANSRRNFPDKAVKLLEQICVYAENSNRKELTEKLVLEYLSQTSTLPNQDNLTLTLKVKREELNTKANFFKQHFFPITATKNQMEYWPVQNFSQILKRDSERYPCLIVSTNSCLFFERAASQLAVNGRPIYRLNVQKLINLQREQNIIPLLTDQLVKLSNENALLIFEDASALLFSLSGKVAPRAAQATSSSIPPLAIPHNLPNMLVQMAHNAGQQMGLLPSNSIAPTLSLNLNSQAQNGVPLAHDQDSFVLRALKFYWIDDKKSCLITLLPVDAALEEGLKTKHQVLEDPLSKLSPLDTINWLVSKSGLKEELEIKMIEKIVFLCHELWRKEIGFSPVDLSYETLQVVLSQAVRINPVNLSGAINDDLIFQSLEKTTKGFIRPLDAKTSLEEFSKVQVQFAERAPLNGFSHELRTMVDFAEIPKSIVKIVETDVEKRNYFSSLIQHYFKQKGNPYVVEFSSLKNGIHLDQLQDSYLENMLNHATRNGQHPILIINKEDLAGGAEQRIRDFQAKGFALICFTVPQAARQANSQSNGDSSWLGQLFDEGARAIRNNLQDSVQVQPTSWVEETEHVFELKTFTKQQFEFYCQDMINDHLHKFNLSAAIKEQLKPEIKALISGYHLIYSQEDHFRIDRIKAILIRDLGKLYTHRSPIAANLDQTIEHFVHTYGERYKISKDDILYEVDPSLPSTLYKMKQTIKKIVLFVCNTIIAPFAYLWKELGPSIKGAIGFLTGSAIFSLFRRAIFGV